MRISPIRVSELAKLSNLDKTVVSKYFKEAQNPDVIRVNNRITGISSSASTKFLHEHGINYFNKGSIVLLANLCGGVGKTSATHALSVCARRIVDTKEPIVIVDTDSQGSFTKSVFGSPASDDEPILIDFLENKANIQDILTDIGDNIWFIKSNLNQVYIDKVLSRPLDIKKGMLRFYEKIFDYLGSNVKIFQDHTPQLSSIFASSVCALSQINEKILKAVIVPMRSDNYAIDGAEKILNEIEELQETFNLPGNIDIHCYFSSIDKRISTTSEAIKAIQKKEKIIQYLSPVVVRYCVEIPKSIQLSTNIYGGKCNKASEDYQDLLNSVFNCSQ